MFYSITEQLNHAARHRNVYFDTVGGDPYGEILVFLSCCILKDEIYGHLASIKTTNQCLPTMLWWYNKYTFFKDRNC